MRKKPKSLDGVLIRHQDNIKRSSNINHTLEKLEASPEPATNTPLVKNQSIKVLEDAPIKTGRSKSLRLKPKRKWKLKLTLLIIFIAILGIGGYFVIKLLGISGSIFGGGGSIFDIWQPAEKLLQDENGRTNILIFGTEGDGIDTTQYDGGQLTDSIMVLSLNQSTKDAYMVSLPRDLYVQHTCPSLGTSAGKLNETYYCNYASLEHDGDENYAASYFMEKVGEVTGLSVQYFIHLDWTALVSLVDTIGGIDFTPPVDIYDAPTSINYDAGVTVHLNGERTLALARARYGLSGGDFDRGINQQRIIQAIVSKVVSMDLLKNPIAAWQIVESLGNNHLRTNFKYSDVGTAANLSKDFDMNNIISLPLVDYDNDIYLVKTSNVGGSSVVIPSAGTYDYSGIHDYINKNLTANPVVKEAAIIDVLNGSGVSGQAATEAENLYNVGFTIGTTYNAPDEDYQKPVYIYQINPGFSETVKALKKRYGVDIIQGLPNGMDEVEVDFLIILGPAFTPETNSDSEN